jgi:Ca-activated chloride channel homolog
MSYVNTSRNSSQFFRPVVLVIAGWLAVAASLAAQEIRFKSGTERVTVAVVVRDSNGRPLKGLSATDFEVRDEGQPSPITNFAHEVSPASIALLLDSSGSMRVGPKLGQAGEVAHLLMSVMAKGSDEAALFGFGKSVQTLQPFTDDFDQIRNAFPSVAPFGLTSLYDAIAKTAQEVAQRPGRHALIVLTDGIDTSSALTAAEVSGIASAIDVPVYVVAVGLSVDLAGQTPTDTDEVNLNDLARWTGGAFFTATNTAQRLSVVREILADLRHQYVLGLEPGASPGWHRLEVRVRQRATTQTRSGYWVGASALD